MELNDHLILASCQVVNKLYLNLAPQQCSRIIPKRSDVLEEIYYAKRKTKKHG